MVQCIFSITRDSVVIVASKWTPIFRTVLVTVTKLSPERTGCSSIFLSCWEEPKMMCSVFSEFSFKKFELIHGESDVSAHK